jgi:hypothetical protein
MILDGIFIDCVSFDADYKPVTTSSLICISEFNVLKACKINQEYGKLIEPYEMCDQSLFTDSVKHETCIEYILNGTDSANIQVWKLNNLTIASGGIMKIYNGKGRTLRFENKNTSLVKDWKVKDKNICMFIPKEILNNYTVKVTQQHLQTTKINLNLFLMKNVTSSFGIINNKNEKCPICLNSFGENESVFYPHDQTHPICAPCTFKLIAFGDNKCPLCRKIILIL